MKKIILIFLSLYAVIFAVEPPANNPCVCSRGEPLSFFVDYDNAWSNSSTYSGVEELYNYTSCSPTGEIMYGTIRTATITGSTDIAGTIYYYVDNTEYRFHQYCCVDPDISYPMPDGNYTTLPGTNSCADTATNQPYIDSCNDAGGYMFAVEKTDCCTISLCIVPIEDNSTSPDDNITCPPPLIKDTFSSTCSCPPDTYLVTVDDEPRCLPNSDCTSNMHISDITNQCICNDGFIPGINLDCILYVPDDNITDDNNIQDDGCSIGTYLCNGQCILNAIICDEGATSDNDPCSYPSTSSSGYTYQGNSANAEECQSYSLALGDGNSQYLKNDDCWFGVCYYNNRTTDNNTTPPSTPVPSDVNGTITDGNSTQNIDLNMSSIAIPLDGINTKLEDIKEVITNQSNRQHNDLINNGLAINKASSDIVGAIGQQTTSLSAVLNSLNESQNNSRSQVANNITGAISSQTDTLGTKLDDIKNAIENLGDGNGTEFDGTSILSSDGNLSSKGSFFIDGNKTNDILSRISNYIDSINDEALPQFEQAISEFDTFSSNLQDTWESLSSDFSVYKDMFEDKPTVSLPSSGSCSMTHTFYGSTIDLSSKLCNGMHILSPFFVFMITALTQLSIIFISIRLFRRD